MKKSQRQLLQVIAGFVISLIVFVLSLAYQPLVESSTFMDRAVASTVVLAGIGSGLVMMATGPFLVVSLLSLIFDAD